MKKIGLFLMAVTALCLTACSSSDDNNGGSQQLYDVTIELSEAISDAEVQLKGASTYTQKTDAQGVAKFAVPAGIYSATATGYYIQDGRKIVYNAVLGQLTVGQGQPNTATLEVKKSDGESVLIIKELYSGGVMKDDNSTAFSYDKCVILYNNSDKPCTTDNLCIGYSCYFNAEATAFMGNLYSGDKLVYEGENFIPAQMAIWYFQQPLTIAPYSQVVVNIYGAIDNTQTVTNSVNYANADYYCMYDPDYVTSDVTVKSAVSFNSTAFYPAPADVIPTSHYLKTIKWGQGNAWALSNTSPALFVFQPKGTTVKEYFENPENYWFIPTRAETPVFRCVKVPNDWIIDAVEVFNQAKLDDCKKRLTADIDGGYVALTNQLGHSVYRNVDEEATKALAENEGKLVYNYSLGVDKSTDPSGINAEASIKNGAHIIYMDTNNSTNDFHERQKCSLRGE